MSQMTSYFFGLDPKYFALFVGLLGSSIATYFKIRILLNPEYRSSCGCDDNAMNGVLTVLSHKKSNILFGIPNTMIGVCAYVFMILMNVYYPVNAINLMFAVTTTIVSAYLWFTMIYEVKSFCVICSTIHAISVLFLFSVL